MHEDADKKRKHIMKYTPPLALVLFIIHTLHSADAPSMHTSAQQRGIEIKRCNKIKRTTWKVITIALTATSAILGGYVPFSYPSTPEALPCPEPLPHPEPTPCPTPKPVRCPTPESDMPVFNDIVMSNCKGCHVSIFKICPYNLIDPSSDLERMCNPTTNFTLTQSETVLYRDKENRMDLVDPYNTSRSTTSYYRDHRCLTFPVVSSIIKSISACKPEVPESKESILPTVSKSRSEIEQKYNATMQQFRNARRRQ
jgi:hypothetical protein